MYVCRGLSRSISTYEIRMLSQVKITMSHQYSIIDSSNIVNPHIKYPLLCDDFADPLTPPTNADPHTQQHKHFLYDKNQNIESADREHRNFYSHVVVVRLSMISNNSLRFVFVLAGLILLISINDRHLMKV